ncbi:hypothetical protein VTL71DRAFT_9192 [Oculimacula yallundae]|uniref:LYR motif-containing protein 2 n=1 Tax=Oculimacula yallundae TaxID=86028 RepID=A0ABR4BSC3_9HELO
MQLLPRQSQCLRIIIRSRSYASQAKKRSSRLQSTISLDHFLQRSKAISLWRSIVRGCKKISDPGTKAETLRFAREEFVRNKEVKDITQIRYLISTGKTQWEGMERQPINWNETRLEMWRGILFSLQALLLRLLLQSQHPSSHGLIIPNTIFSKFRHAIGSQTPAYAYICSVVFYTLLPRNSPSSILISSTGQ